MCFHPPKKGIKTNIILEAVLKLKAPKAAAILKFPTMLTLNAREQHVTEVTQKRIYCRA